MWQATVTKARKAWQTVKECACGLFVAALQLTSRPMPKRKQCPICYIAHNEEDAVCASCGPMVALCEAWLVVRGVLEAGAVIVGGALLALAIWAVVAS